MNEKLLFLIIEQDKMMRRIITDFIRQMVRGNEISDDVEVYDSSSGKEALSLCEIMFKATDEGSVTYKGEPITPLPGTQGKVIVICNVEMEPMGGGRELLQVCMNDEILRDMSFILMAQDPDLGLISELGELGVTNILAKPLTLNKLSHTIRNVVVWVQSEERSHYKKVELLLDLGEYGEALTLIKNAESKYTNLKWVILRGRAHLGLNETDEARNDFEQVEVGAHTVSIIALKHMVQLYEASGDTKNGHRQSQQAHP